ncbi:MAG: MFS transporter [Deltaproteobacteria bacterium]|nr:MFS transporter [Deltaproteobacteria bacterium]
MNAYKWKVMLTAAVALLMASMDASITNIAFPTLTRVFQAELTTVMWVTLGYILVSTTFLLILGKISDIMGRKRIFVLGIAIFTLGLVACSLARGIGDLILFRCLQGLGAAMLISCSTALVTEAFPVTETGRGMGLLGVAVSLGFVIGPILGGLLLDWLDWRSIFYVRAPITLLSLFLSLFMLRKDEALAWTGKLDWLGAIASSTGILCLTYGVSRVSEMGLLSFAVWAWTGTGILLLAAFVYIENHVRDPIIDLTLFRNRVFRYATLALFLTFVAAPFFILVMPFYFLEAIRLTPSEAGLLLAVNSMATIVSGPISGSLSDRLGAAWFAAAGAAVMTLSFVFMLGFDLQTGAQAIVPALILLGVGIGMFQPPNNSLILGSVPRTRLGTASALMATLRQVGLSLGMALAGTLYAYRISIQQEHLTRQGLPWSEAVRSAIPSALHEALGVSILLSIPVIALSFLGRKAGRNAGDPGKGVDR